MTQIFTRQWGVEDWQIYKSIRLEALTQNSNVFGASYEAEAAHDDQFWKDRVSDNRKGAVFGLYDGGAVIGLTGIYRDWNGRDDMAVLVMSYIRPEYRKRGLSELLYQARIDWAKAQGDIRVLSVGHREGNDASRGANQRWGFVFQKIEEGHPYGNGDKDKNYVYELKI